MSDLLHTEPRKTGLACATPNSDRLASQILACILFSFAIFAIWPAIDLCVSQVFHDLSTGFVIDGHPLNWSITAPATARSSLEKSRALQ